MGRTWSGCCLQAWEVPCDKVCWLYLSLFSPLDAMVRAFLECHILLIVAEDPETRLRGNPRAFDDCGDSSTSVEAPNGGLQGRVLILKTPKKNDFLSTAFAPMPLAPDFQNTRRARMTPLPVVECRDEATCLRPNFVTGHRASPQPDTTESKTLQVELQRTPQPTSFQ